MMQMKFVLVVVALFVGQQSSLMLLAAGEGPKEMGLAVDITTKNGNHIEMPFFTPELTSIEPELRDCLVKDTQEVVGLINGALGSRLRAKKSRFGFVSGGVTWTKLVGQMTLLAHSQEARRPKSTKRTGETRKAFNKSMQALFRDMLKLSKKEAAKIEGEAKNPEALADEIDIYLSDLVEALQSSPVGPYVNWDEAKYNGEDFKTSASKVMGKLNRNGYGAVFTSIDVLLGALVTFSG